jgi:hypothetical protein
MSVLRPALAATCLLAPSLARADPCGELIDRVARATAVEVGSRSADFASFTAGPDTGLTLSCGSPSSVGAQFRGEAPPERYYALLGQAGEAVTGIAAGTIAEAAQRAQAAAGRQRHSNVTAGGLLVTCSVGRSEKGNLTLCAVIESADRS